MNDHGAPNCDDQFPSYSATGIGSICEIPLHSRVGKNATAEIPVHSTIGRGPRGEQGIQGIQGPVGPSVSSATVSAAVSAQLDAKIVLVPADQWPPVNPVDGVLYLRATSPM